MFGLFSNKKLKEDLQDAREMNGILGEKIYDLNGDLLDLTGQLAEAEAQIDREISFRERLQLELAAVKALLATKAAFPASKAKSKSKKKTKKA
jgi:regulator of replication initiation timing